MLDTPTAKNLATKIGVKYLLVSMARRKIEKKNQNHSSRFWLSVYSAQPIKPINAFGVDWLFKFIVYSSTLRSPMIFCEVMYVIHYFFYIMTNNKNNYLKIYFLFFFCLFSTLQTANKGKFYTYYMYINSTAFCILELYISSKIVDWYPIW